MLEEATVASVHAAMRRGDLTCRQLVQRYLDRIDAYDRKGPKLNAILAVNPAALETADKLDAAFKADPAKIGRLHCAPVILKDNFDTADMKTTGASVALKDNQPKIDAFTVQRLRMAGAVILAKANLQELAMGGETVSSLGGQTLNPYDLTRTPGGSSGGTGAAIAANFGMIGTGSDTGQSIRSPSSAQSLVGIRATRGLVSRHGVIPLSSTLDEAGPITRSVEDAARALDAMAGYDPKDPVTAASFGKIPRSYVAYLRPNALQGARIGIARDLFGKGEPHAEVNRVTEQAIKSFAALGAEMIDVTIPNFAKVSGGVFPVMFEMKAVLNSYLGAPELVTQVRTRRGADRPECACAGDRQDAEGRAGDGERPREAGLCRGVSAARGLSPGDADRDGGAPAGRDPVSASAAARRQGRRGAAGAERHSGERHRLPGGHLPGRLYRALG